MPPQRRKRLPNDFFDRLLSNQTDDQINDLLNSLVDEQIAPSREVPNEAALRGASRPALSAGLGRRRDKSEESIITRDEELDEGLAALSSETQADELIPPTPKMQTMKPSPVPPSRPDALTPGEIETLAGVESAPVPATPVAGQAAPMQTQTPPVLTETDFPFDFPPPPDVPPPPDMAPSPGRTSAPAGPVAEDLDFFNDQLPAAAPAPPAPTEPVRPTAAMPAKPTVPEPVRPAAPEPVKPVVPEPVAAYVQPSRQELRRNRVKSRWGKMGREPKRPKLAIQSRPVSLMASKVALLDDYLQSRPQTLAWRIGRLQKAALFFLLPAFIAFSLFSWYPMLKGLVLSFFNYSTTGASVFVGGLNYVRAFQDAMFWKTLMHAGLFCVMAFGLGFWLPIFLAILINEFRWGRGLAKFIFFLPFLMPTVPAAILWKWIMDQGYGVLNSLLTWLPLADPHIGWLTHPKLALFSIVMVYIWKNTGWAVLIYSAALSGVDETLYEEAEMSGASIWNKVRHVTLPAMAGVIGVMAIITIINTLQLFTEVYIMTGGGPMNATEVIATYIYKQAFFYMDIGYASALSILMLLMVLVITTFRLRWLETERG